MNAFLARAEEGGFSKVLLLLDFPQGIKRLFTHAIRCRLGSIGGNLCLISNESAIT
jgi:hypothetical protein